jgi:epoxyqueuosine reductase
MPCDTARVPEPAHRELRERVVEKARALGFDAVGIARADEPLELDFQRYEAFVDAGMHGTMQWLASDREVRRRLDGEAILPGARSVVCLARRYARGPEAEANDPPFAELVARYARGQDYHNHLRKKLRLLAKFLRTLAPDARARPLCDEEPLLERAWASRAGLGFVGKNGLVIVPGKGSYLLLGEVVTTLDLPADTPMAERCGSCRACLDACPTKAFVAPFVLDARRCISYLTIEARELPSPELEEAVGTHLFGCDDCQSVCPFNRTRPANPAATRPFVPLERWSTTELSMLLELDEAGFLELTQGSPLRRAGRLGLARNAVLVARARLRRAPNDEGALALVGAARHHDDPKVRELAARPVSSRCLELGTGSWSARRSQ